MDAGTFTDPTVADTLNRNFVCVKVNGDDVSLGTYVKRTYGVRGYPTVLVLRANGALKGSLVGYRGPADFTEGLSQLISTP